MKSISITLLLLLSRNALAKREPPSSNAILLSNIHSLTLHAHEETSHRRVSAIPQLRCIGGNARGKYEVDTMRCTSQGSSYDAADVQWTCTASLPDDFKLGSTNVICEGYSSPDDEYVLKGSCGVEYRLMLTSKGEAKYGRRRSGNYVQTKSPFRSSVATWACWIIFIAFFCLFFYAIATGRFGDADGRAPRRRRGGRGRGGYRPDSDDDDDPPPYDYPYSGPKPTYGRRRNDEGWRPGFWTGLGAGGVAGYAARGMEGWANSGGGSSSGGSWDNGGEGSSESARYTSTGFGGTSRR